MSVKPSELNELLAYLTPQELAEMDQLLAHDPTYYQTRPLEYCREVLKVTLTEVQAQILLSLTRPPYRTLVKSAHNVGKTFLAACAANWWYDSFDPSVVITTAPSERDVVDLLWTEIRALRNRAGLPSHFIGPRAPEMRTNETHYAKGYTAQKGERFQGRHRERMFFIFDEAEEIEPSYFTTTKTMFKPEQGHAWLCIFNPTTTTAQTYIEESAFDQQGNPSWRVIGMSALDHPNIAAQLAGQPSPIPDAVSVPQIEGWLTDWCERVDENDIGLTDFEWPPESAKFWRPGPIAEARILGRRPSAGTYGVWSDALWEKVVSNDGKIERGKSPEIGCDVARFGDDWTAIHVRWGSVSLHHESHNGWATDRTAGRLKQLCDEWARKATAMRPEGTAPLDPKKIVVKIDDDGVGGGVTDQAGDYAFVPISSGANARHPEDYPNVRSELWFTTAERAKLGMVSIKRLSREIQHRLKQQAMAPVWKLDAAGRRVVEPKADTKKKIGRSPDDLDAMNLAYLPWEFVDAPAIDKPERFSLNRDDHPLHESAAARRGLYGLGGRR